MKTCVLLLSGGIDSVCTASILRARGVKVFPVFCDYGQVAALNELKSVRYFADRLKLEKPRLVKLDVWSGAKYPLLTEDCAFDKLGFFLPLRNLQLAVVGAVYAAEIGVDFMVFGFHSSSGPEFTDTTPAFLDVLEKAMTLSLLPNSRIRFWRETCRLTKSELIAQALSEYLELERTYSCYRSTRCMECAACAQVDRAFAALTGRFPATLLHDRNPNSSKTLVAHA